jgi:glycosyltransferase involved in cell wall biosynthesis
MEEVPVVTVTIPQIPSFHAFNLIAYRILGWWKVRAFLQGCDLIHSVDLTFAGDLASSWARLANIRHVTQVIADVETTLIQGRRQRSILESRKYIHGVACNSRMLAKQLLEYFPDMPNVCTVYRGVDLIQYQPQGPSAGPFKDRPPVRFLYLGGFPLYPQLPHGSNTKGGETLLVAWREAEESLISSGASLLVAGPQSESPQIARWLRNLRQPNRVHVVGHILPSEIPSYIRASDVVLVPSMEEGLPNVAMEASACGRPVFGSNVGGIPEVVVNGETGLVLPAGDVAAWENALIAYATKASELETMGSRARQRMETLFDAKQYAPRMMDLYTSALREPLFCGSPLAEKF